MSGCAFCGDPCEGRYCSHECRVLDDDEPEPAGDPDEEFASGFLFVDAGG